MTAFWLVIGTDISSLRSWFLLYNIYVLTVSKLIKMTIPILIYLFTINTYYYQDANINKINHLHKSISDLFILYKYNYCIFKLPIHHSVIANALRHLCNLIDVCHVMNGFVIDFCSFKPHSSILWYTEYTSLLRLL